MTDRLNDDFEFDFHLAQAHLHVSVVSDRSEPAVIGVAVGSSRDEWTTLVVSYADQEISNYRDYDPDRLAQRLLDAVLPYLPDTPRQEPLNAFHDGLLKWICDRRRYAERRSRGQGAIKNTSTQ